MKRILIFTFLLVFFNLEAQNIANYYPSDGLNEGGIYAIEQDHNGHMWFGSWTNPVDTSGLSKFDGTTWTQYTTVDGLIGNHTRVIFEDKDNNLWVGTTSGISVFNGASWTNYTTADGLVHNYVFTIVQDNVGDIWIGTNGGVSRFNGSTFTNYTGTDNAAITSIYTIIQDNTGNIWFGSSDSGAIKFDGVNSWTNYNKDNSGLEANDIWVILQDKNDHLWFANYFGPSITKFDGSTWDNYTQEDGLPNVKIRALAEDSFGDLWIGSNAGATKFDGSELTTYSNNEGLIEGGVRSFFQDDNDDLWVGTWSPGVSKMEISKIPIPDSIFEKSLVQIGIDSDGIINGQVLRNDVIGVTDLQLTNPLLDATFGNPLINLKPDEERISDLTGIEAFKSLIKLGLSYSDLTSVDLSFNKELDDLFLTDAQLTEIDVYKNTKLRRFGVMRNPINNIDVRTNVLLEELFLNGTNIQSIDLSNQPSLWKFYAHDTNLTGLDVSLNPNIVDLRLYNNPSLAYLNVKNGNNTNIEKFYVIGTDNLSCVTADVNYDPNDPNANIPPEISMNMVDSGKIFMTDCGTVYIPDPNFEQALISLGITSAPLDGVIQRSEAEFFGFLNLNNDNSDYNINDLTGIESFINITGIDCSSNTISELDLSNNGAITEVYFHHNAMQELNLGTHLNLEHLHGGGNSLSEINLSGSKSLKSLHLWGNVLSEINLSLNDELEELVLDDNRITNLDISYIPTLKFISLGNNRLTSLNIANGNNVNFVQPEWADYPVYTRGNPNLECIQVDDGILYSIPSDWSKPESTFYSGNCNAIETGWGLVGSNVNNWGGDGPDVLFNTTDIGNVFQLYFSFPEDGHIKFRKNEDWGINFGDNEPDGELDAPPNAQDIAVTAGVFKITLDLNQLTYAIEPDDRIWGIVGSATPNSWGGPDMPMTYNPASETWTADVSLTEGHIKFRFDNDWSVNQGDNGLDGTLEAGGADIPVSGGDYFITLDLNNNTYKIESRYVYIKDEYFEQSLIDIKVDSDGVVNESILRSDAVATTSLNLNNPALTPDNYNFNNDLIQNVENPILDLTGIEAFVNLTNLQVSYSGITTVNVSSNTALEELWITDGVLEGIDVTSNTALRRLGLMRNEIIGTIDVSNNPALEWFLVHFNNINSLNVINNTNLTALQLNNNLILDLDVSQNTLLQRLDAQYNSNLNLFTNDVIYQDMVSLNLSGIGLSGFNGLQVPNVQWLLLSDNTLTELNLSDNHALNNLFISNNSLLEHLDMRNGNNVNVERFFVGGTPLLTCVNADANYNPLVDTEVPVEISQAMIDTGKTFSVDCGDFVYIPDEIFEKSLIAIGIDSDGAVNQSILREDAESVDILNLTSKNFAPGFYNSPALDNIQGQIEDATGIEAFVNLTSLSLAYSLIDDINVSALTQLQELWLNDNALTSIDVSTNTSLLKLGVMRNVITGTLDVSTNTSLLELWAHFNQIDNFISGPSPNLYRLAVQGNNLSSLDLVDFPDLIRVSCNDNNIGTLDISTNTVIDRVDAQRNLGLVLTTDPILGSPTLRSLNLSGTGLANYNGVLFPNVEWLFVNNNNLTKFNGNNTLSVKFLNVSDNQIEGLNLSMNPALASLNARNNFLSELDLRNGNNINMVPFNGTPAIDATGNLLTCISVDDPTGLGMPYNTWLVDPGVTLSTNCKAAPEVVLIPDPAFEAALGAYDTNGPTGNILLSDALAITTLNVSGQSIDDLTGIAAFENLLSLNVSNNNISSIAFETVDYGGPTDLESLDVTGNELSELFVVSGRSLQALIANNNQLHTVNFSDLTDIVAMDLSFNQFTNLDFSSHDLIASLAVSYNPLLTELNLINGNNTAIVFIDVRNNSSLECIGVDDPAYSIANVNWFEDSIDVYNSTGDCTAPTVVTQDIEVVLDRNGLASISPNDIDNGSTDNVSAVKDLVLSIDTANFDCDNLGYNTITLTVTDEAGNIGIGTGNVTLVDNEPPTANAVRSYTYDLAGQPLTLDPAIIDDGSTDNCGIDNLSLSQDYFTLPGTYYVDLIATDLSGNQSSDPVEIEVTDSVNSTELKFGGTTVVVHPNPFTDVINLTFSKTMDFSKVTASLSDGLGGITGVVFTVNGDNSLIATNFPTNMSSGTYILSLSVGNKSDTAILIKN